MRRFRQLAPPQAPRFTRGGIVPRVLGGNNIAVTAAKLAFISGSTRKASLNRKLVAYAQRVAAEKGHAADTVDFDDYPMPLYNGDLQERDGIPESARRLKGALSGYPGIFISAPEYNAGITPLLKNTLDWLSRIRDPGEAPLQLFKTRVFAIASASPSMHGGTRGLLTVRQVLAVGLGALVLPDQLALSRADQAFDEAGQLKDEAMRNAIAGIVDRLAFTAVRFQP
jgi:NAD(P)H-dependent FMN reductase